MKKNKVTLKVVEALQDDAYKGIVITSPLFTPSSLMT
jgi:hypothetical protein